MDFRTELKVLTAKWGLKINDPILTLGSCFSQSMGQRFQESKFNTLINPFGTTYHPLAIHRLLDYAADNRQPAPPTYLKRGDIFLNYDFHSSIATTDQSALQKTISEHIQTAHEFLKRCSVLILTYGTAWAYERIDNRETVANCHRVPGTMFSKKLTSAEEITASFQKTLASLRAINPAIRVILTVSPVRHVKDTLPLNSVSKSILRLACHQIAESCKEVDYFPAYELMLDDLRDYRYYKDDLIHPTALAENYIWEKFSDTYFSAEATGFLKKWTPIRLALLHRPFQSNGIAHQEFLTKILGQLEELKSSVSLDQEIQEIKSEQRRLSKH